jgi:hypothetical protein
MAVADDVDIRPLSQDLGMDWPFLMQPSVARQPLAGKVDQYEIFRALDFAQPDAGPLKPHPASTGIAQRQMAERHVSMAFDVQDATAMSEFGQRRVQILIEHRIFPASQVTLDLAAFDRDGRRIECRRDIANLLLGERTAGFAQPKRHLQIDPGAQDLRRGTAAMRRFY